MSKKMWNKIFKSKSSKNSKSLTAATKANKRCSIYEEYQQLNTTLDLTNNEKFNDETDLKPNLTNFEDLPLPSLQNPSNATKSSQPTKFTKVVNSFTLKRSQNKDAAAKCEVKSGANASAGVNNSGGRNAKEKSSEFKLMNNKLKAINSMNVINNTKINSSKSNSNSNTTITTTTTTTIASSSNSNSNRNNFIADSSSTPPSSLNQFNVKIGGGGSDGIGGGFSVDVGRINTPYASLNHQLTATTAIDSHHPSHIEICNNNSNEIENFACKNLSKPTATSATISTTSTATSLLPTASSLTSMQRLSKIIIVVRKFNASSNLPAAATLAATLTPASDLATNGKTNATATTTNYSTNDIATTATNFTTVTTTTTATATNVNSYTTTTPTEKPDPTVSIQLAPCPICSRTFNPVTLRKHVGICEKMATKRRNVFDSSRQRREGTELASYPLPKNFGLPEKASSTNLTRTKSERGQSPNPQQVSSPIMQRKKPTEDFVRSTARTSMRKLSTSSATDSIATTNFSRDRLRSSERSLTRRGGFQPSPGEQCPHCDRCFGIKAYDRHVEWCKEKALQASIKHQATSKAEENVAKARLEARTKYKAPCLKTKRSVNRDKYSGFAGDDNEDSPKSLRIGNKAHDSSLMSMSMTSSITSERKINKPTGNRINEASTKTTTTTTTTEPAPPPGKSFPKTPAPAATSNAPNRKRSRDITAPKLQPDDLSTDEVANFQIEMPDLRWVGEQMTTSGASKKITGKPLRAAKEKTNAPVRPAKTKTTTKIKQQHVISSRLDHKLPADVIHSVAGHNVTHVPPQHKKTPSDLSLKTKKQIHFKESHAAKTKHKSGSNTPDHSGCYDNNHHARNDDEEAKERISPVRKVDLTKSLTFYASPCGKNAGKTSTKSFDDEPLKHHKQHPSIPKMTMEEYFNNGKEANDMELESLPRNAVNKSETFDTDLQENLILGSKKIMSSRHDVKKFPTKSKMVNKQLNREASGDDIAVGIDGSCNLRDVLLMHSEELIKSNEPQTNQCFFEGSHRMTMEQTYPESFRAGSEIEIGQSKEGEDDGDDATLELSRKIYMDLKASSCSKKIPTKSITKPISKDKMIAGKMVENQSGTAQNKCKERKILSNEKLGEVRKMLHTDHQSEMPLSCRSADLADEAYILVSKPKRFLQNATVALKSNFYKSNDSLATLENYKTELDEVNSSDCKLQTGLSPSGKTSSGAVQSCFKPNQTSSMHDLSSTGGETDDEDKALKTCTSKADTFIKSDSESDDGFTTPPEIKVEVSDTAGLSYDDLRSLIPNFRSFSPPKRTATTRTMEERKASKGINSKQQQKCSEITRTLTPRLTRASTPPPPISTMSGSLPNTPRSSTSLRSLQIQAKLETSPIKSLSIYRPQRTKVLRQTFSSTSNTGPMKAIPLTKETIEIYGVSSASHFISQDVKRQQDIENNNDASEEDELVVQNDSEEEYENVENGAELDSENMSIDDQELKIVKDPPNSKLERNKSFTVSGLPDNYDPFLSAKRQLEDLCSPTDSPLAPPQTPQLPSLPATPAATNRMSTSLTLGSSTPYTSSPMTTSQTPQTTANPKTPTLARSSSFRRTGSLRGPRRSPLLTQRVPLFAQKHRPTIQRGLSDEGPISTNFLKPEEYDEMPVRSVCVNDYALSKSPRVVRRDTSALNRKQPLKLNINAANNVGNCSGGLTPDITETESAPNTASRYVSKTDSLAVFLKYETELEKLNKAHNLDIKTNAIDENANPSVPLQVGVAASSTSTQLVNLDGPLNAKELKDKSNNLSKQNSAKNIKAEFLDHMGHKENTNENLEMNLQNNSNNTPSSTVSNESASLNKYGPVRLTPLSKPSTPTMHFTKTSTPVTKPTTPLTKPSTPTLTKPSTPTLTKPSTPLTKPTTPLAQTLTPLNVKIPLVPLEQIKPQKPVALSSLFSEKNNEECKNSQGTDYIDPKLINKCDNLPVNLNKLRGSVFKTCDSDTSDPRMDHFSSSSSESSAPATKFLPTVKTESLAPHSLGVNQNLQHTSPSPSQHSQSQTQHPSLSQRNSAEGRNLLKRRMRLGRNQFLYDASPEVDSCSADDEANRSSMECERFIRDQEKAFDRFSATQINPLDAPFIPPPTLPAEFEDFDFEEFLSSFENDEEQFPLFKDCREFLLNRTSKKQRSMLIPNSNVNVAQTKKSTSTNPRTFPPLTPPPNHYQPQHYQQQQQQNFQFPNLPQHKGLFESFSLTNRSKNRTMDQYPLNTLKSEEKREIFISIETEQNDLDKSPISPNSIRHIVGNPQCVVEVEVNAHAHDNKFSKISDDDEMPEQQQQQHHQTQLGGGSNSNCQGSRLAGGKQFCGHGHLPNVQLNNAKNLIQQMQEDFRHLGEEMSANIRQSLEHQRSARGQGVGGSDPMPSHRSKAHKATGTPSGDAYADSDELSSLDGYPLSSPNSRLGVSSKTSADSAYGSLSRQRSSELTNQRNTSSRHRPLTSSTAAGNATIINRPLTEERSRQLSASSSSSSEHALPPIGGNNNYQNQQQQQQQQHLSQLYSNNNNNINNNTNSNSNPNDLLDDMLHYEHNNNFDTPIHPSINVGGPNTNANATITTTPNHTSSNHETPMSSTNQLYGSTSTMSSSMKVSRFCHECGSRFLLEHAKFCMDCGVKRIVL